MAQVRKGITGDTASARFDVTASIFVPSQVFHSPMDAVAFCLQVSSAQAALRPAARHFGGLLTAAEDGPSACMQACKLHCSGVVHAVVW